MWSNAYCLTVIRTVMLNMLFVSMSMAGFLKYPFDADFDVKTARYQWNGSTVFSINIINYDTRSYDSLDLKIYFRSPEGLEKDLVARPELFVEYQIDGIKKLSDSTFLSKLSGSITSQFPQKIENTFRSLDNTHAYSLRIPLNGIILRAQGRIRIDIGFVKREPISGQDILDEPSAHYISNTDWTFGSHSKIEGDLIDFNGVDSVGKENVDTDYWRFQTNYYLTIHRNNKLLWGIPPNWQLHYDKDNFIPTDTRPVQDPIPYAPIAVPFNEFEDPLVRDSANLRISSLLVNQAGYRTGDKKYFYCITSAPSSFSVLNTSTGSVAGSGTLKSTAFTSSSQLKIKAANNALLVSGGDTKYILQSDEKSGTVYEGELPDLPEGRYRIVAGGDTSAPFIIRSDVYNMVKDALLKFYGVNRCGDSKSWFHLPCHLKDAVTGGWHDCGDHLKEGATMSYTAAVLGLAAAVFSDVDQDLYDADQSKTRTTDGIPDILYEAKHGADFVLRSYDLAGGDVSKMVTSMGGFGNPGCGDDHSWWGPPEIQDLMPASRGGPPRCARNEATTDFLAKYAANLAFVSKCMRKYDTLYAERCLTAATAIYTYTSRKMDRTNTAAYNGATIVSDDAAFGCLALLWATGERKYLDELCFDTTIGRLSKDGQKFFQGGFFANNDPVFYHSLANTDWSSVQTHVLWGFFRLILADEGLCISLGLSNSERSGLIEKTMANLTANVSSVGLGTQTIPLPEGIYWVPSMVKYDLPWFTMHTQMEWVWNRYQAGNITDMYYYYDIAKRIQGMELPGAPASTNWKAEEVKAVMIRMMDYMLGVNPWDISMIYGVGFKNFNHPHHRASNPEGRSCITDYHYRHLVGALQGGYKPVATNANLYNEFFDDYMHAETGINGTTNILMPVMGLCVADRKVSNRKIVQHGIFSAPVIHVIPNRTDGSILIRSTKPLQTATLYTISGRLIRQQKANTSQPLSILLRNSTGSGMYLLQVKCVDGTSLARVVSRTF